MNLLQKTEVWLRSEILEHIARVYGLPKQAREAASAKRVKEYPQAIAKIIQVERFLSAEKNAEVSRKFKSKAWEHHKAREKVSKPVAKKSAEKKRKHGL